MRGKHNTWLYLYYVCSRCSVIGSQITVRISLSSPRRIPLLPSFFSFLLAKAAMGHGDSIVEDCTVWGAME